MESKLAIAMAVALAMGGDDDATPPDPVAPAVTPKDGARDGEWTYSAKWGTWWRVRQQTTSGQTITVASGTDATHADCTPAMMATTTGAGTFGTTTYGTASYAMPMQSGVSFEAQGGGATTGRAGLFSRRGGAGGPAARLFRGGLFRGGRAGAGGCG